MEHYVTVFDGLFLPQGIALHRSLQRHAGQHTLWVLCVDAAAYEVLARLNLPNVRSISAESIETDALRAARRHRTRAEYCWTLTPQAPQIVLSLDPSASRVTYVDADFWFLKPPGPIFSEFEESGKGVLITEHAYAPDYDQSATSGRYCVQFVTFKRSGGEEILNWWGERCIEWCFARFEDGKFGDQKYLDDWPQRFSGKVHVLGRHELILAPWNATRFPYGSAVAYHFHGLRLLKRGRVLLFRGYEIPRSTRLAVYAPYVADLAAACELLASAGHPASPQAKYPGVFIRTAVLGRKLIRAASRMQAVAIDRFR